MTLQGYLSVLGRRRWLIVLICVVMPLVAVFLESRRGDQFRASADVLVTNDNAAALLGNTGTTDSSTAERYTATQASLARTPALVQATLRAANVTDTTTKEFLDASSVSAVPNEDILRFSVKAPDRRSAIALATAYAREFPIYRRALDERAVGQSTLEVQQRINALKATGDTDSALYNTLVAKKEQLAALAALQTTSAQLVRPADEASQVQPRPARMLILSGIFAVMIALGLAFAVDALDTRVRSQDEIESLLDLPLLAELPAPPVSMRDSKGVTALDVPEDLSVEAFRVLRTNLEFTNLDLKAKVILVTSAFEAEGKTTTATNLAVLLAQSGWRVALVDCDLRRPSVAPQLGVQPLVGISEVARGVIGLDKALQRVALPESQSRQRTVNDRGRRLTQQGALSVLPAGVLPPSPGEFVGTQAVTEVIRKLRQDFDIVLVDTPPVLRVGDALTLSKAADAVLLVVRLGIVKRQTLRSLRRALDTCPARELGFALTDARAPDAHYSPYRYPFGDKAEVEPSRTAV